MRFLRPVLLLLAFLVLLAGCASGPPKRVFPPQVSIQEMRMQADGQWSVDLRIRNFSTVPMTFSRLRATLRIGDQDAATIDIDPALAVGPGSSEIVAYAFAPSPALKAAVEAAVGNGRGTRYRLAGEIDSSDPGTEDEFEYQSALDPIPGLPGVLR